MPLTIRAAEDKDSKAAKCQKSIFFGITCTYGDVFTIWLGPIPHVSICDYETSQEVFVKNGNKYKDRFMPPIFTAVNDNLGLFAANGDQRAEMRRFTLLTFRNLGVGRELIEQRILDELEERCAEIDADATDGRTVVHVSELMDLAVGNVLNSILVGKRFVGEQKDEFWKIKRLMDTSAEVFTMFDMTAPLWFLRRFFPGRLKVLTDVQGEVLNYISREALERYQKVQNGEYTINSEDPQDFVEAYLAKIEEDKEKGVTNMYTMECLKHVIGDLWFAGQDTTATTLVSGFNQLVNHPEVIQKCREELLTLTGNGSRPLSLKDRAEPLYLNATIAEIQRHASVLNVNFWMVNHEATTVKGHPLDSGAVITAQLGALHVNNDIFKNAEGFYPERFIENPKLLNQLIPFGIGKRSCVGENIARSEIYMIIGNLLLRYDIKPHGALPSTDDQLPYTMGKMPDKTTYGDVFTIWLGPIPHVSICDYETSHEVFVKNGNRYKDRFLPPIFTHVNGNLGLISANGESWAEMRRFTLGAFRTMGVGRELMEQKILDELEERCAEIDAEATDGKTVVHVSGLMDLAVGNVLNSVLVGKRFVGEQKEEFRKIKQLMDSSNEVFTTFDMMAPLWFLRMFFPGRLKLMNEVQDEILNYISREALERYQKVQSGEHVLSVEDPQDFVEAYLAKIGDDKEKGVTNMYTMECLKHVIGDLWFAGQDTTATTLVSGFNQLVNHPEVIEKCREELMRLTDNGSRPLSLKDRAESHYLNATIAEIQRHASILNVNFYIVNYEPTTIKGYPVDSGAVITAQLGALHVNNDIFKNAEKFYPERFIENPKLLNQVIPFGIGKRSCVGEHIARSEIYMIIGYLLLRYDIKPHGALPSIEDQLSYSAGKQPDKTVKLEFVKL
ncbi:hypothetical protein B9Z55_017643 [Caenorhabditis nigoni]|uniref:Cytochrome P450 n=2 Tax=Caenorhabditis nigoni TaxID=1611254 RepID=A0A2G5TAD5_9PELO|nr:hypothetical protein B9Z55_017643 [Caenorhabditis nigoni]